MKNQRLWDVYLNWKGLSFIHGLKSVIKWFVVVLSLVFTFVSLTIQNYYILGASLILFFLQILSENKKDYYLRYKKLFEKIKVSKETTNDTEWIDFLESTVGLNSWQKGFFGLFLKKKFKEEKNGN
jgi:hypothetical protein